MTEEALNSFLSSYDFQISSFKKLEGYGSQNFLINCENGERYVLKINDYDSNQYQDLLAENNILFSLKANVNYQLPIPILNKDGDHLIIKEDSIVRCLKYLDGEFWGDNPLSQSSLTSLGTSMAFLDLALIKQAPNAIHHRNIVWDLQNVMASKPYLSMVENVEDARLIQYYFDQINEFILPQFSNLRKSLIHNDFNPWNVLIRDEKVSGLIDFGDMVYGPIICELAVSLSYVLTTSKNILEDARLVISSYQQVLPLEKKEIKLLYHLIAGRIITSLCNSAKSKKDYPDNPYIGISEKPYRQLLHQWIKINPLAFEKMALDACGLSTEEEKYSADKVKQRRVNNFSSALSLSYAEPIHMASAAFQYMHDYSGNSFLDAYNNIPLVGHSHPAITEAISKQAKKLNTNTRYHYPLLGEYAEKLLSYFPKHLNKIFLVNSGSAASDLAIRLATNFTGQKDVFVIEEGYHGNTQIGIDVSPYKFGNKGGKGAHSFIHQLPLAKEYNTNKDLASFLLEAENKFNNFKELHLKPAAIIAEMISGCGGQVPHIKGYLPKLFNLIKAEGGLCIADEVQTGFGRLGQWFWGFEMQEVTPDIVILGKPIGNGHPLGAVVCTSEVAEAFDNGMEFFSSFGGNPVSCAAGLAVLNVLEKEELQVNAKSVGAYWKNKLIELQKDHHCIGDVRGEGLFLGIEIMDGPKEYKSLAKTIKNEMRRKFILTSTDGKYDNVIKVKPPLCFSKENVDHFIQSFHEVLEDLDS